VLVSPTIRGLIGTVFHFSQSRCLKQAVVGHTGNDLGSTLTAQQQKGGRKAAEKS
jgi:hypothetical protein